ncbi:MAG: carboxypeptidase C (cathepsin A) [Phycisphaerales bacterium]|jgi:carboxypeptidase C (cathepsin A)
MLGTMRTILTPVVAALAVLIPLSAPARAQDKPEPAADYTAFPDTPAITYHTGTFNGTEIHYLATAGTTTMVDRELEPAAKMFHISYRKVEPRYDGAGYGRLMGMLLEEEDREGIIKDLLNRGIVSLMTAEEWAAKNDAEEGEPVAAPALPKDKVLNLLLERGVPAEALFTFPDPKTRPLTFSFNGGPGSSSVWLHMGLFGPERVNHADEFGNPGAPPYETVHNEFGLLDRSDFVFIDPISTGYSRAEEGTSAKDFHGLENDISSVGEFIRRWLGDHDRWASPKFLAGESYGTTRAAGLAQHLVSRHGISLNGIMLISAVTNFQTIRFNVGNDDPHLLYFPSFAATARFHGKLSDRLTNMPMDEFVQEVRLFTLNEYAPALLAGDTLPADEVDRIAGKVSEYLGITADYAKRVNLRFDVPRFNKELRRDEGLTVGRLDSRFTGIDRDDAGSSYEYDPSMNAINSIYTESFNDYVRRDLGYDSDLVYEILTGVYPWSYGRSGDNSYANVSERLRGAMHRTPSMKVFIASGYYDLATPFFATDYTTSHMQLDPSVRGNITTHYYEAGHMMYVHGPSLAQLRADLDGFYDGALGE